MQSYRSRGGVRIGIGRRLLGVVTFLPMGWAAGVRADSVTGSALALQSSGQTEGTTGWQLTQDGYVGTYITLSQAAQVSFDANAFGAASAGLSPDMTISIADTQQTFSAVGSSAADYTYTTSTLPAGTYFVRVQLDNQTATQTPQLDLNNLTVSGTGVSVANSKVAATLNTNALAAAQTYINNFRQGQMTAHLVNASNVPIAVGTSVQVTLAQNSFNLGSATYDTSAQNNFYATHPWLTATASSTGTAALAYKYQQFVINNFNMTEPENAGKWASSNGNSSAGMVYVDQLANFTAAHNMGIRMHNLIYATQQPSGITADFAANNTAAVQTAVNARIAYYAGGTNGQPGLVDGQARALSYTEMDVLNEAAHAPTGAGAVNYLSAFGTTGVAAFYKQVATDVAAAGANTRLYTNEFNVLQNSSNPATNGADPYANWYRNEVESLNNAGLGNVVSGVGVELYATTAPLSPATMQQGMQNLAVTGLPMSLTEFGIATGTSASTAATDLQNAFTMVYGNPNATTFDFWDFWQALEQNDSFLTAYQAGALMDDNGNPTSLYTNVFLPLMKADGYVLPGQITPMNLQVAADGTISFNGSYGTYDVKLNGLNYLLTFSPTETSMTLIAVPEPCTLAVLSLTAGVFLRRQRRTRS